MMHPLIAPSTRWKINLPLSLTKLLPGVGIIPSGTMLLMGMDMY